jgi:hypothetical protein
MDKFTSFRNSGRIAQSYDSGDELGVGSINGEEEIQILMSRGMTREEAVSKHLHQMVRF